MHRPAESHSDDDEEDKKVILTDFADVVNTTAEEVIALIPHQRCPSHTLNLIVCSNVDKWLLLNPGTEGIYGRSAQRYGIRQAGPPVASEIVDDVMKLLVSRTTR